MMARDAEGSSSLGADLRALRKARGLTLQEMSGRLGRSVGWLSQVERNISTPSITDLRELSQMLDVSVSTLFRHATAPTEEASFIVRSGGRRPIGSRVDGLVEELLSPDLTDAFEMVISTFEPGATSRGPVQRPTQELAYLIAGRLNLRIAAHDFTVETGDSFRIRGETFEWFNPYDDPAQAIWVIAPPIY